VTAGRTRRLIHERSEFQIELNRVAGGPLLVRQGRELHPRVTATDEPLVGGSAVRHDKQQTVLGKRRDRGLVEHDLTRGLRGLRLRQVNAVDQLLDGSTHRLQDRELHRLRRAGQVRSDGFCIAERFHVLRLCVSGEGQAVGCHESERLEVLRDLLEGTARVGDRLRNSRRHRGQERQSVQALPHVGCAIMTFLESFDSGHVRPLPNQVLSF